MEIVIIGGNLFSLLCADLLSKNHKIMVLEINPEPGFPTNFLGYAYKKETLETILESKTLNLNIKQKENLICFRSEWFMKLLCHKLAKKGVKILNRCRVLNYEYIDKFNINTSIDNNLKEYITADLILDFTSISYPGPGNNKHKVSDNNKKIHIYRNDKIKQYFVGTCLLGHNMQDYLLCLDRNDNLSELIYESKPVNDPENGWIEAKNVLLIENYNIASLDYYYSQSKQYIEQNGW